MIYETNVLQARLNAAKSEERYWEKKGWAAEAELEYWQFKLKKEKENRRECVNTKIDSPPGIYQEMMQAADEYINNKKKSEKRK